MHEFLLMALAHWLALLSPGPDFLLLSRTTLRHGFRPGTRVAAGIAVANGLWIVLALSGVGYLQRWPAATRIMQTGGALFLLYVGWHFLRARPDGGDEATPVAASASPAPFLLGLASGLGNPKNGLFYTGLFSIGIAASTPSWQQALYGLWMFALVWVWDVGMAWLIGRPASRRGLHRWQWKLERLAGALLMALGIGLLLG